MKRKPLGLSAIAADFLATLLWLAYDPDANRRPFRSKSIHDFSPALANAAARFADGFTPWLESKGFDLSRLDRLSRSVGGSLYLSLSGHGAGFFDEYPPEDSDLGPELHRMAAEYAGGQYRFHELECTLCVTRAGKIALAIRAPFMAEYLERYFSTPITAAP